MWRSLWELPLCSELPVLVSGLPASALFLCKAPKWNCIHFADGLLPFFCLHLKSFVIIPPAICHTFIFCLALSFLFLFRNFWSPEKASSPLSANTWDNWKTVCSDCFTVAVGQRPALRSDRLLASVKYLHHLVYFSCLSIWICSGLKSWWVAKERRGQIPAGSAHEAICHYFWVSGAPWRLLLPTT